MGKGDITRSTILDKALAMASQIGLEGLSIGTLAKETQLSKSGLFAHFNSKEELQLQVIQEAAERFIADVVQPALRQPRGEPRVKALFERWLEWARAPYLPGGCLFLNTAQEFDDRPGAVRDLLVTYQKGWLNVLATAAQIAIAEGHFRADLEPVQFAHDLQSIYLGYHYFSRLLQDAAAETRTRAAFASLLDHSRTGVPRPLPGRPAAGSNLIST